ncbi:prohibitin family protein [Candidatus Berkelbacteria bacterium]|nr:prohibitin family protein [Candidatus Berkelbacteria bacterium]MBI4029904.1 prohibitin family protein [Candidatus Berkelbacteria bacterium]
MMVSFILKKFHAETRDAINLKPWAWTVRIIGTLLVVIGLFASAVRIVPAGHRGVQLRFGAVRGQLSEGIHLVTPWIDSVVLLEVRTQKESSQASAASRDLQIVTTNLALNFHIDPSRVGNLYRKVGLEYKARIIDPAVQESIKMVTAKFTAEELIKSRQLVKAQVEQDIARRLRVYQIIVEPGGLSITNFDFSKPFNAAIERKQVAQQEAEQQRYVLQKAELEKKTKITQAEGVARAAELNAAALQSQGGSLVLTREWIEKWDGHVPTVSGGGQGVIIDINKLLK